MRKKTAPYIISSPSAS